MLRLKEHLQGRDNIVPLKTLASRCDPEAWRTIETLFDYYPKQNAPEIQALAMIPEPEKPETVPPAPVNPQQINKDMKERKGSTLALKRTAAAFLAKVKANGTC